MEKILTENVAKEAKEAKEAKKTTKKATKSTVKKVTPEIIIQSDGAEYILSDMLKKVEDATAGAKDVKVYVKPSDKKIYFVADGVSGSVEM